MSASAAAGTITLVFDEALDSSNLPAFGKFVITIGGSSYTVTGLSVSGNSLVITLNATFTSGALVSIVYTDDAGNQTLAVQDAAGNDVSGFSLSKLADGYIWGAQIYLDANGDGIAQDSEKLDGVVTDETGNFFMSADANPNGYAIIAVGGINTDTGLANTISLKAPAGSTTVNPLTTMVQSVLEANPGLSLADAMKNVAKSLGLPEGLDFSTYDPISVLASGTDAEKAYGLIAQKAAAQIASMIALASGGDPAVPAPPAPPRPRPPQQEPESGPSG